MVMTEEVVFLWRLSNKKLKRLKEEVQFLNSALIQNVIPNFNLDSEDDINK